MVIASCYTYHEVLWGRSEDIDYAFEKIVNARNCVGIDDCNVGMWQ